MMIFSEKKFWTFWLFIGRDILIKCDKSFLLIRSASNLLPQRSVECFIIARLTALMSPFFEIWFSIKNFFKIFFEGIKMTTARSAYFVISETENYTKSPAGQKITLYKITLRIIIFYLRIRIEKNFHPDRIWKCLPKILFFADRLKCSSNIYREF